MNDTKFSLLEFLVDKLSTYEGMEEVLSELSDRAAGTEVYVGNFKEVIRKREVLKLWTEMLPNVERKTLSAQIAYKIIAEKIKILPTSARTVRYIVSGD